jgi:hypothetical protein
VSLLAMLLTARETLRPKVVDARIRLLGWYSYFVFGLVLCTGPFYRRSQNPVQLPESISDVSADVGQLSVWREQVVEFAATPSRFSWVVSSGLGAEH